MAPPGSPPDTNVAEDKASARLTRDVPPAGPRVRRVERLVILLSCLAYVGLALWLARGVPLVMDEVDYVQAMRNWRTLGLPVFAHGYVDPLRHSRNAVRTGERRLGDRSFHVFHDPDSPSNHLDYLVRDDGMLFSYGLWHPPLYVWLGRWLPLAARPELAARLFNIALAGGAFLLTLLFVRRLYPARPAALIAAAVAVLACKPAVFGAPLTDVHSGLGPLAVVLWVWTAGTPGPFGLRRAAGSAVALALVFSCSLSLGAACVVAFAAWRLFGVIARQRPWAAVMADLLVVVAGIGLFAGVYAAACHLYDLPAGYTFFHNFQRAAHPRELAPILQRLAGYLLDLNPPLLLLVACAALAVLWRGARRGAGHALGLPLLTAAACVVMYASADAHAYLFNKYVISAGMLLAVVVAGVIANCADRPDRWSTWLCAAGITAGAAWGAVTAARQITADDRHPYLSDVTSMLPVAEYLRGANIPPSDSLICDKDIAFLLDRPFYEAFGTPVYRPSLLPGIAWARRVWVVLGPQEWCDRAPLAALAREQYECVYALGRYAVFVGPPPQPPNRTTDTPPG